MHYFLKYFDFVALGVCLAAFWLHEHVGVGSGLALGALGATGLVGGGQAIIKRRHSEFMDEGESIEFSGLAAVLLGLNISLIGAVALALGVIVAWQVPIGAWLGNHLGWVIMLGGLLLVTRGGVLLLGSKEARPKHWSDLLQQPSRIIGLVLCLLGLGISGIGIVVIVSRWVS